MSSSESTLAAAGRAAPLDTAVAIAAAIAGGLATAHPEWLDAIEPEHVAACGSVLVTLGAALRAWLRSRKRIRESRRAARAAKASRR